MTGVMEHCDDKGMEHCDDGAWNIVMSSSWSILKKVVREHCDDICHGPL